ncbi:MAG TPA: chorismate mutase, partial [Pyrinomonadaceae bacterium]|nr:chorismate mutase [Pyrinomonadaceae bacterium]
PDVARGAEPPRRFQMTVEDCRAEMASIDNELLCLLNRRARLARRLGSPAPGPPAAGPTDADALDRACRANAGPLDEDSVARIFRRIIRETRRAHAPAHTPDWHAPRAAHEEVGELV